MIGNIIKIRDLELLVDISVRHLNTPSYVCGGDVSFVEDKEIDPVDNPRSRLPSI